MTLWIRYKYRNSEGFGVLERETINVFEGDMFSGSSDTGQQIRLNDVEVLTPTVPKKMIALWNNFHTMADKAGNSKPSHPLYFFKASSSFAPTGSIICRPESYNGRVVYEGEIGIVVGKSCRYADAKKAKEAIFGYTCINDITAADIISSDDSFAQWTRSKSFDGFGVFGPVVATGLEPSELRVVTKLNGDERQNYPVNDMIIPPEEIVRLLSQDVTLEPGDVICCGTNVGVGSMKEPENKVEITIDQIGTLSNLFKN